MYDKQLNEKIFMGQLWAEREGKEFSCMLACLALSGYTKGGKSLPLKIERRMLWREKYSWR